MAEEANSSWLGDIGGFLQDLGSGIGSVRQGVESVVGGIYPQNVTNSGGQAAGPTAGQGIETGGSGTVGVTQQPGFDRVDMGGVGTGEGFYQEMNLGQSPEEAPSGGLFGISLGGGGLLLAAVAAFLILRR